MGPQNVIIGDNFGTEFPQPQIEDDQLNDLKNAARFSKTKEFKKLKELIEARINYWQQFVPGAGVGDIQVDQLSNEERGWRWLAADQTIKELQRIINAYEGAEEYVKDAATRRT